MKILVIDDDAHITDLLPVILGNEGFRDVECFSSPVDGLAALKVATPAFDCLILDIEMPEIDGIELCRQIRALPSYQNVPVIMLTAKRDDKTVRAALSAGATDYITKPFDILQIGVRLRMSARLVRAHRALNYLRTTREKHEQVAQTTVQPTSRREIVNIFADVFDWTDPVCGGSGASDQ